MDSYSPHPQEEPELSNGSSYSRVTFAFWVEFLRRGFHFGAETKQHAHLANRGNMSKYLAKQPAMLQFTKANSTQLNYD